LRSCSRALTMGSIDIPNENERSMLWLLADILTEVRQIRLSLEDDDGEEDDDG
jgi:hypothetical protein